MDVKKVAKLAHLEITEEEVELYTPQMDNIVAYVEQLNELNTDETDISVGGLTREGEETKTSRPDIPQESLGQEKALEQAPSAVEGHFQVPKVL
jgi:aspartyl-tRNA(Asn)/glutamyl-tRNA(Gln) amidotransferase subunit C